MNSPINKVLFETDYFGKGALFSKQVELARAVKAASTHFNSEDSLRALVNKMVKGDIPSEQLKDGIFRAIELLIKDEAPEKKNTLLEKIKTDFEAAVKVLQQSRSVVEKKTLRIASGYILFAAPVVEVMKESAKKRDDSFSIALYGESRKAGYAPYFNTITPPTEIDGIPELFNGNDLLRMLEQPDILDAICIAEPLYDKKQPSYAMKVATIVNTQHSGVYLQVYTKNEELKTLINDKTLNWERVRAYIDEQKKSKSKKFKMPLFYFEETLSQMHLTKMLEEPHLRDYFKTVPISQEKQNSIEEPFTEWFDENKDETFETFGFIGWQPYIEWYCEKLKKKFKEFRCAPLAVTDINSNNFLLHFEFILAARKAFVESKGGVELLQDFMEKVSGAIKSRVVDNAYRSSADFGRTATFFGIDSKTLIKELDNIFFDVKYSPEFVKYLVKEKK